MEAVLWPIKSVYFFYLPGIFTIFSLKTISISQNIAHLHYIDLYGNVLYPYDNV